jgi:cytochrome c oxidase subunit 3
MKFNQFSYDYSYENNVKASQKHPFHLVDPSPWPLVAAIGGFTVTSGFAMYMHNYNGGLDTFFQGILITLFVMFTWWRDIVREGTFEGQHTFDVQTGLRLGMILFIVSEIMFFFAFFWAFFHSSLVPLHSISSFPPKAVPVLSAWEIPLLNTAILLSSGATITWAHHAIVAGDRQEAKVGLVYTIMLAIIFTELQAFEYINAPFTISDSVYGSCFYLATGFHGLHVFIGTCFLVVCTIRLLNCHFTKEHHFGFEAAAWYWHFVDVVWLFLFVSIYWFGGY